MNYLLLSLSLVAATISVASAHQNEPRYAPGVPPVHQHQQQQQYQQPPQQQQQQYQQQQGQQQQQQYQQPQQGQQQQYQQPQQGQQQQQYQQVNQMNQQQPPVQGHGHGHDDTLRFSSDVHNAEHVMEHLENVIETKPKDQMTEEELEFHYFKMHDYDDNNKLDGVEIGKALTHYHAGGKSKQSVFVNDDKSNQKYSDNKDDKSAPPPDVKIFTDDEIANIVDTVLKENDLDGDGYIEYSEFKRAQEKEKQKPPPPEAPPKQ